MPHKKSERLRRICVVALADNLVKHLATHTAAKCTPYGIIIPYAEMVTGNNPAPVNISEIFDTSHLFYYELTFLYHRFKELSGGAIGNFIFNFIYELFV